MSLLVMAQIGGLTWFHRINFTEEITEEILRECFEKGYFSRQTQIGVS